MEIKLMMVHKFDRTSLTDCLAEKIVSLYHKARQEERPFSLLLPGGNSPIVLFKRLAVLQRDWTHCYFFLGDERYVDIDDLQSNRGMIEREFLAHIDVDKSKIIFPRTDLPLELAAHAYHQALSNYLELHKQFDCAIVGMGGDGHTLSIFPGQNEYLMQNQYYFAVPRSDVSRISGTWELLDRTRSIHIFAPGMEKYRVFCQLQGQCDNQYPIARLMSMSSKTHWYLSEEE